jgi:hypothetical protein
MRLNPNKRQAGRGGELFWVISIPKTDTVFMGAAKLVMFASASNGMTSTQAGKGVTVLYFVVLMTLVYIPIGHGLGWWRGIFSIVGIRKGGGCWCVYRERDRGHTRYHCVGLKLMSAVSMSTTDFTPTTHSETRS